MKHAFSFSKLPMALIFAGTLAFASCKKDNNTNATDNPDPQSSIEAAQNDNEAEQQIEHVFNISMGVQYSDAGEYIVLAT
jgi:hypothetical protein